MFRLENGVFMNITCILCIFEHLCILERSIKRLYFYLLKSISTLQNTVCTVLIIAKTKDLILVIIYLLAWQFL